jgi:hypothetical protein
VSNPQNLTHGRKQMNTDGDIVLAQMNHKENDSIEEM